MARNAEIVFWANMPAGLLTLAIVPHLVFVTLQAAWRLARGRLRPLLLGKRDALRLARDPGAGNLAPSSLVGPWLRLTSPWAPGRFRTFATI